MVFPWNYDVCRAICIPLKSHFLLKTFKLLNVFQPSKFINKVRKYIQDVFFQKFALLLFQANVLA
jgi:hypothetical protein